MELLTDKTRIRSVSQKQTKKHFVSGLAKKKKKKAFGKKKKEKKGKKGVPQKVVTLLSFLL